MYVHFFQPSSVKTKTITLTCESLGAKALHYIYTTRAACVLIAGNIGIWYLFLLPKVWELWQNQGLHIYKICEKNTRAQSELVGLWG